MLKEIRSLFSMLDELDSEPSEGAAVADAPAAEQQSPPPPPRSTDPGPPAAFIVDGDATSSHAMAQAVGAAGVDTLQFTDGAAFAAALAQRRPAIVFLDVNGQGDEAIDVLFALGNAAFEGPVQLMGVVDAMAVVDVVKRMGLRQALRMLPVLPKPLDVPTIRELLRAQGLDFSPVPLATGSLDQALANDWIEFWYQPKINLARKQIAGVETFARVRHPELGTLPPGLFMQGASDADLVRLAQRAVLGALGAATTFSELGINLRLAVNLPVQALLELPIPEMIRDCGPKHARWPGLLLDVTEEQVVDNLEAVYAASQNLASSNVTLAIDDFGRAKLPPSKLRELPFAELKLDRAFVDGCAGDKPRSTICRTVIELAHHFGCTAVAVGIEKIADMRLLAGLGCDLGQGYLFGHPVPEAELVAILMERAVSPAQPASGSGDESTPRTVRHG